jgi:hypothetical protein
VDGFSEARGRKIAEFSAKRYTNPGRLATIYSLLRAAWALLCESPFGEVFQEFTERFVSSVDLIIEEQGRMVSEETEVEKFLAGLRELLASNPSLIQSKEAKMAILGRVIGKETDEGLFLLPSETLAELAKIGVFTQKPTVDSLTKGLHAAGKLVVKDPEHLKPERRMNGSKVRGWLLSPETCTPLSPVTGDTKNDGCKPRVAGFAGVASENEREKFSDGIEDEKQMCKSTGDTGDTGDSTDNNKIIDSDLIGSKRVSGSVAGGKKSGDTPGSAIGPHPRKDEPTPTRLGRGDQLADSPENGATSAAEQIRVAALMEYGINGEVDPAKLAGKLHIQQEEVTSWLEANYAKLDKPGGVVRYTQRRSQAT